MAKGSQGSAPSLRLQDAIPRRWWVLLTWLLVAVSLPYGIPSQLPAGPTQDFSIDHAGWTRSAGMQDRIVEGIQYRRGSGPGPHITSRALQPVAGSEFLAVEACIQQTLEPEQAAVLLASINGSSLDFNRHYALGARYGASAGDCLTSTFSRREGDGSAVLQLQLYDDSADLAISRLTVTPERENPTWRWTRRGMLTAGIALVAVFMAPYASRRPRIVAGAGLMVVVGILFGCCVSVPLKADIYALLTGGRTLAVPVAIEELLLTPFPIGGFSLFTNLHAVLFACATVCLGTVYPRAWQDLMLLGVSTEILQIYVPGRGPGLSDVLVDWLGIGVGMILVVLLRRSQRVRLLLQE